MRKTEIEILFEDNEILVVHKPAGLAVQTAHTRQKDLVSELRNYRARQKEEPYIGVVHRLDQPVEGVMVFAKTKKAAADLSRQVAERSIGKEYLAVVHGKVEPEQGKLLDVLLRDGRANVSKVLWQVPVEEKDTPETDAKIRSMISEYADAKAACLEYRVLSYDPETDRSQVRIYLHTGRHHQIRVQFSSRGWPLVGDAKYGDVSNYERKLMLCSCKLEFVHPGSGEQMVFELGENKNR